MTKFSKLYLLVLIPTLYMARVQGTEVPKVVIILLFVSALGVVAFGLLNFTAGPNELDASVEFEIDQSSGEITAQLTNNSSIEEGYLAQGGKKLQSLENSSMRNVGDTYTVGTESGELKRKGRVAVTVVTDNGNMELLDSFEYDIS